LGTDYDSFAYYYDLEYQRYVQDLDFYRQFASRTGSPILELACGTGRVVMALARAGYKVTGLDLSEPMLAIARQHLAQEPDNRVRRRVQLVNADMRSFSIPQRFSLAFYAVNSFMHLTSTEEQIQSLACVREHLVEGGLVIVDLYNPDQALLTESIGHLVYERTLRDPMDNTLITKMVSSWVDRGSQINHMLFLYDRIGANNTIQRQVATISQRYLYRYEAELVLRQAGFQIEQVYGSYELDPFAANSLKMIIVARRHGNGQEIGEREPEGTGDQSSESR